MLQTLNRHAGVFALLSLLALPTFGNDNLVLWSEKPAAKWTEAFPIGNGRHAKAILAETR